MSFLRPEDLPRWATRDQTDTENINTKLEPGEAKKSDGWQRFEKPAYNIFNWWMELVYRWLGFLRQETIDKQILNTTDGNGEDLIAEENVMVVLYAIDTSNTDYYLHAIGYRGANDPSFNIIDSNQLTLGTPNGSTQPINNGSTTDIIANVRMIKQG